MKKFTTIFLALVMAFSLTACGGAKEEKNEVKTDKKEDVKDKKEEKPEKKEKEDPEFEEAIIVDNDEIKISLTGVEPNDDYGYIIKTYIENKTEDTDLTFTAQSASVNSLDVPVSFYNSVSGGKRANDEITLDSQNWKEIKLGKVTEIALNLEVYDTEYEDVYNETVYIYPEGQDNVKAFERKSKDTDQVILDNDYARITVIGTSYDDIWGYGLELYLENKTDSYVMFGVDNVYVNGYDIDPYFANSVLPGASKFETMSWDEEEFDANGIDGVEGIEDVEFNVRVYDNEDWSLDNFVDEVVTYVNE